MSKATVEPSRFPAGPGYFCMKCLALAREAKRFYKFSKRIDEPKIECPVCTLMYVYTEDFSPEMFAEYLASVGCSFEIRDPAKQPADPGQGAGNQRGPDGPAPAATGEMISRAIGQAQAFVHFSLPVIPPALVGALKVASSQVPVRGITGEGGEDITPRPGEHTRNAMMGEIRRARKETGVWEPPPRSILVIDGLAAFTGGENLISGSPGGEDAGNEAIETVTDPDGIFSLHNKILSPLWAATSDLGEKIFMDPA